MATGLTLPLCILGGFLGGVLFLLGIFLAWRQMQKRQQEQKRRAKQSIKAQASEVSSFRTAALSKHPSNKVQSVGDIEAGYSLGSIGMEKYSKQINQPVEFPGLDPRDSYQSRKSGRSNNRSKKHRAPLEEPQSHDRSEIKRKRGLDSRDPKPPQSLPNIRDASGVVERADSGSSLSSHDSDSVPLRSKYSVDSRSTGAGSSLSKVYYANLNDNIASNLFQLPSVNPLASGDRQRGGFKPRETIQEDPDGERAVVDSFFTAEPGSGVSPLHPEAALSAAGNTPNNTTTWQFKQLLNTADFDSPASSRPASVVDDEGASTVDPSVDFPEGSPPLETRSVEATPPVTSEQPSPVVTGTDAPTATPQLTARTDASSPTAGPLSGRTPETGSPKPQVATMDSQDLYDNAFQKLVYSSTDVILPMPDEAYTLTRSLTGDDASQVKVAAGKSIRRGFSPSTDRKTRLGDAAAASSRPVKDARPGWRGHHQLHNHPVDEEFLLISTASDYDAVKPGVNRVMPITTDMSRTDTLMLSSRSASPGPGMSPPSRPLSASTTSRTSPVPLSAGDQLTSSMSRVGSAGARPGATSRLSDGSDNKWLTGTAGDGEKARDTSQSEASLAKRNTFSDADGAQLYTTGSRIDDQFVDNLLQQRLYSTRASDLDSQLSAPRVDPRPNFFGNIANFLWGGSGADKERLLRRHKHSSAADAPSSDADVHTVRAEDLQRPVSAASLEAPAYERGRASTLGRIPRSTESEEGYTDANSVVMVSKLSVSSVDSLLTQTAVQQARTASSPQPASPSPIEQQGTPVYQYKLRPLSPSLDGQASPMGVAEDVDRLGTGGGVTRTTGSSEPLVDSDHSSRVYSGESAAQQSQLFPQEVVSAEAPTAAKGGHERGPPAPQSQATEEVVDHAASSAMAGRGVAPSAAVSDAQLRGCARSNDSMLSSVSNTLRADHKGASTTGSGDVNSPNTAHVMSSLSDIVATQSSKMGSPKQKAFTTYCNDAYLSDFENPLYAEMKREAEAAQQAEARAAGGQPPKGGLSDQVSRNLPAIVELSEHGNDSARLSHDSENSRSAFGTVTEELVQQASGVSDQEVFRSFQSNARPRRQLSGTSVADGSTFGGEGYTIGTQDSMLSDAHSMQQQGDGGATIARQYTDASDCNTETKEGCNSSSAAVRAANMGSQSDYDDLSNDLSSQPSGALFSQAAVLSGGGDLPRRPSNIRAAAAAGQSDTAQKLADMEVFNKAGGSAQLGDAQFSPLATIGEVASGATSPQAGGGPGSEYVASDAKLETPAQQALAAEGKADPVVTHAPSGDGENATPQGGTTGPETAKSAIGTNLESWWQRRNDASELPWCGFNKSPVSSEGPASGRADSGFNRSPALSEGPASDRAGSGLGSSRRSSPSTKKEIAPVSVAAVVLGSPAVSHGTGAKRNPTNGGAAASAEAGQEKQLRGALGLLPNGAAREQGQAGGASRADPAEAGVTLSPGLPSEGMPPLPQDLGGLRGAPAAGTAGWQALNLLGYHPSSGGAATPGMSSAEALLLNSPGSFLTNTGDIPQDFHFGASTNIPVEGRRWSKLRERAKQRKFDSMASQLSTLVVTSSEVRNSSEANARMYSSMQEYQLNSTVQQAIDDAQLSFSSTPTQRTNTPLPLSHPGVLLTGDNLDAWRDHFADGEDSEPGSSRRAAHWRNQMRREKYGEGEFATPCDDFGGTEAGNQHQGGPYGTQDNKSSSVYRSVVFSDLDFPGGTPTSSRLLKQRSCAGELAMLFNPFDPKAQQPQSDKPKQGLFKWGTMGAMPKQKGDGELPHESPASRRYLLGRRNSGKGGKGTPSSGQTPSAFEDGVSSVQQTPVSRGQATPPSTLSAAMREIRGFRQQLSQVPKPVTFAEAIQVKTGEILYDHPIDERNPKRQRTRLDLMAGEAARRAVIEADTWQLPAGQRNAEDRVVRVPVEQPQGLNAFQQVEFAQQLMPEKGPRYRVRALRQGGTYARAPGGQYGSNLLDTDGLFDSGDHEGGALRPRLGADMQYGLNGLRVVALDEHDTLYTRSLDLVLGSKRSVSPDPTQFGFTVTPRESSGLSSFTQFLRSYSPSHLKQASMGFSEFTPETPTSVQAPVSGTGDELGMEYMDDKMAQGIAKKVEKESFFAGGLFTKGPGEGPSGKDAQPPVRKVADTALPSSTDKRDDSKKGGFMRKLIRRGNKRGGKGAETMDSAYQEDAVGEKVRRDLLHDSKNDMMMSIALDSQRIGEKLLEQAGQADA